MALVTAVGATLEPGLIAAAIRLMAACNPPNDQALYSFIDRNADQLDDTQRRSTIRLATWPVRADASRFGGVLGWVAMKKFPDAGEIQMMWRRWIGAGAFDGEPSSPKDLARYLADAHKEGLPGWEAVNDELRSHVRRYLRSGDKAKVLVAIDHIQAVADQGAPILNPLLGEAISVEGTAEWNAWEKRDRDAAEQAAVLLGEILKEAAGDRNWLRAMQSARQTSELLKEHRRMIEKEKGTE